MVSAVSENSNNFNLRISSMSMQAALDIPWITDAREARDQAWSQTARNDFVAYPSVFAMLSIHVSKITSGDLKGCLVTL
jgi:hypothetical protein